ncbi:hypothetical protein DM02DRAFT_622500 [Periconia macrospinosa]|uniref:EKC/KEOPS complex subunit GON7 n=1 Tax=Periconia macrospinosa TaxID=97972 RepID=A0A2V1E9U4_9PLEO|nr:hypothetical protein DM02DRAFT_622500 [Periconia macrospinosa]
MPDLTATYTSPTVSSPQIFTHALPPPSPPPPSSSASAESRTAALAALQSRLRDLQADINTFLTAKMGEDRAAAAAASASASATAGLEGEESAGKRKREREDEEDEDDFEALERAYGEDVGE